MARLVMLAWTLCGGGDGEECAWGSLSGLDV